jgi:hypothetical protein
MSVFQEYPKAIYSAAGKMAIVGSLDAENEQRSIWGEEVPVEVTDLPLDLGNKLVEPASEPVAEPAAEPVAETPAAEVAQ